MADKRDKSWISRKCDGMEPCSSWIGLAAAMFSFMVIDLIDSFGVYYDSLVEKYDSTRAAVGWIFSFRWIFINLPGIFISPLIDMFGCRSVTMVFGLLYSVATALSAFAPTVGSLYFIFGMLTGVGDIAIYLVAVTAIQQLFTTNRGFATGFATMGIPLGLIVHPIQTQYFLEVYGVGGVYLMHGAISLHILIAAFAFKNQPQKQSEEMENGNQKAISTISQSCDINKPEEPSTSSRRRFIGRVRVYLRKMIDFRLLRKISFILSIIHFMLLWMVRLGITSQIVSCAKFRGIPDHEATYLLSIAGFVGLCMTVVSSIIMNMPWLNSSLFSGFAALCLTISAFGCAFSQSYEMFIGSAVFVGIADGIALANLPMLVFYVGGIKRVSRGVALLFTLILPSAVGSSNFVGWMVDIQGNFVMAFNVLAVGGIISMVLSVVIVILVKRGQLKAAKRLSPVTVSTKL